MDEQRLQSLLDRFGQIKLAVVGDFFLDKYLWCLRTLSERSLETGLEAYQVVDIGCSPGAAGTVTSNLCALGVGQVFALGVIGDDGQGYELKRGLSQTGVHLDYLLEFPDLFTPTYTKPMMREPDGTRWEMNRLDVKNRKPMPEGVQRRIIESLGQLVPEVAGVIVLDQVQEPNQGVVTQQVRESIIQLARRYPDKVFLVDSRTRVGLFRQVPLKANGREAVAAIYPDHTGPLDRELICRAGQALQQRTGRPLYLTLGEEGMLVFNQSGCIPVPAIPVTGEIDPVGAGDSTTAGIVSALCSGAGWVEAALLGTLIASITVQQVGTTGTASPAQVMDQFNRAMAVNPAFSGLA